MSGVDRGVKRRLRLHQAGAFTACTSPASEHGDAQGRRVSCRRRIAHRHHLRTTSRLTGREGAKVRFWQPRMEKRTVSPHHFLASGARHEKPVGTASMQGIKQRLVSRTRCQSEWTPRSYMTLESILSRRKCPWQQGHCSSQITNSILTDVRDIHRSIDTIKFCLSMEHAGAFQKVRSRSDQL